MIASFVLCGLLLLGSVVAGQAGQEFLFIAAAIMAIFFWASLFSLFPITIGHYYGNSAAGANYGALYAVAKGTGGIYGGILTSLVITSHGFSYGFVAAGILAIVAGLMLIPLRFFPVVWRGREPEAPRVAEAGRPAVAQAALDGALVDKSGIA
jgi:OFA family oxalate/formate antiporter-like MFS transporter